MSKTALLAAGAFAAGKNKSNEPMKEKPSTLKESVAMKPIAWLLIAGVVGFVIVKAGKGVAEAFRKWQAGRDIVKEKNELEKTQKLSYPISQYQIFAGSLYDAFQGTGTDEPRIKSVFSQMKNNLDVLKLIEVYGTRDGGAYFWTPKMTLIEQIRHGG
ncbi:hypothetical protein EBZ57_03795 [bacterium]|nr:hypothetical protein [bacterium]